jgi:hypothetical protein
LAIIALKKSLFPLVKYLGKQNGFAGGSYLNLTSGVELQPCNTSGYSFCQNILLSFLL